MLLVDALEIVLRIQRLIFVNFCGILRYQRNGWSSWIIHERISPSWQEVSLWFVLPIFRRECRERSSALKESLGLKSKYRLKPGSIPTLKAPNIESTVILSWATFHMLSTNKMAALPTCGDVGSTKSQRFSDFLCVMHIVPSTKSRFIEFSKDSWSKLFCKFWNQIDKIWLQRRRNWDRSALYTTVHVCWTCTTFCISRTILCQMKILRMIDINSAWGWWMISSGNFGYYTCFVMSSGFFPRTFLKRCTQWKHALCFKGLLDFTTW